MNWGQPQITEELWSAFVQFRCSVNESLVALQITCQIRLLKWWISDVKYNYLIGVKTRKTMKIILRKGTLLCIFCFILKPHQLRNFRAVPCLCLNQFFKQLICYCFISPKWSNGISKKSHGVSSMQNRIDQTSTKHKKLIQQDVAEKNFNLKMFKLYSTQSILDKREQMNGVEICICENV